MAIFSRRTLQRLINENARFLSKSQLKEHTRRLNKEDEHSLGAEWEVVLLNVFSKLGTVTHEPDLGTRPDLYFVSNLDKSHGFIADIATVSDRGIDEVYPIQALSIGLNDILCKRGLKTSAFGLRVGTEVSTKVWPRPNPRFKIPHRSHLDRDVFNEHFFRFLDAIALAPDQKRTYRISDTRIEIQIKYDPDGKYYSRSWPYNKELTSLVHNTIYSRLEEKATKLARANYSGPAAIIVCDGGCDLLSRARDLASYHVDDAINYFLRENAGIAFVLTFVVQETAPSFQIQRNLVATLYRGKCFSKVGKRILEAFDQMGECFPEAERTAQNAGYLFEGTQAFIGRSFGGASSMSDNEIRISARGLLELLSGKITQEQFFKSHSFVPMPSESRRRWNPFKSKLSQGSLITEITVESGENERDDDWLTIKFGGPDPAVSPFELPPQESRPQR
ncbi:MAG: hypothetical protein QOF62_740 [Pyrinomonadaceae bacterium]|jgi:hypothetical protein|nr:hypothetical protein [Pyrinomonadaceae bacterium]